MYLGCCVLSLNLNYFSLQDSHQLLKITYGVQEMIKNMSAIPILNDDLHVFISDDSEMTQSIDLFIHFYSLRKKLNAEYWLLDISAFESLSDIIDTLGGIHILRRQDFGLF